MLNCLLQLAEFDIHVFIFDKEFLGVKACYFITNAIHGFFVDTNDVMITIIFWNQILSWSQFSMNSCISFIILILTWIKSFNMACIYCLDNYFQITYIGLISLFAKEIVIIDIKYCFNKGGLINYLFKNMISQ